MDEREARAIEGQRVARGEKMVFPVLVLRDPQRAAHAREARAHGVVEADELPRLEMHFDLLKSDVHGRSCHFGIRAIRARRAGGAD